MRRCAQGNPLKPLGTEVIRIQGEGAHQGRARETISDGIMLQFQQVHEELGDPRSFFQALFNSMPMGVLVVDSVNRVRAVNPQSKTALGIRAGAGLDRLWGEVMGCPEARAGTCGKSDSLLCQYCDIRSAILRTFEGLPARRRKASIRSRMNRQEMRVDFLVSTSLTRIRGETLCIVLLEDVTECVAFRERAHGEDSFAGIVGKDPRIQDLFQTIRDLADRRVPVLIRGESGTGKELVACAIHGQSSRARGPFVAINCGAIPESLFESELFGHVKGAFTGAVRDKKGRFELASGGTLFLDEVAELSPLAQVKLLRVLQEGTFEPVGSERTVKVDVRVVSATNKDLATEMKEGRFRSDLYYRLCIVPVALPPLRERPGDIPLLATHLLERISEQSQQEASKLAPQVLRLLTAYPWPGNVRELENVLHYAIIQSRGGLILPEHIDLAIGPEGDRPDPELFVRPGLNGERVAHALRQAAGNRVRAARMLGVSRSTLYRFLGQVRPDLPKAARG